MGTGRSVACWVWRQRKVLRGRGSAPFRQQFRAPLVAVGAGTMEGSLFVSSRVPFRLKELGAVRAAQLIGCAYCSDVGSSLLPAFGMSERAVADIVRWRDSDAFDDTERLVLELAEVVTATPVEVPPGLLDELRERMSEAAVTELVTYITWENWRGRFNHTFGIGASGFCELGPRVSTTSA